MKTITITLKVPDNFSDFDASQLVRHCKMLADPDWMAIFWGIEDVKEVAPHLTDDECRDVLATAESRHDANVGICWITLETIADMLYDRPNQGEEEEELDEA